MAGVALAQATYDGVPAIVLKPRWFSPLVGYHDEESGLVGRLDERQRREPFAPLHAGLPRPPNGIGLPGGPLA